MAAVKLWEFRVSQLLKRVVGWCVLCGENGVVVHAVPPLSIHVSRLAFWGSSLSRRGFRRGESVPGGGSKMPHFLFRGLGFLRGDEDKRFFG